MHSLICKENTQTRAGFHDGGLEGDTLFVNGIDTMQERGGKDATLFVNGIDTMQERGGKDAMHPGTPANSTRGDSGVASAAHTDAQE